MEEIRPVALEWKTLHGGDPFSDASLNYLWDALEPGDTKSFQAEYAWGDFWKSSTIADYEVIAYEVVY